MQINTRLCTSCSIVGKGWRCRGRAGKAEWGTMVCVCETELRAYCYRSSKLTKQTVWTCVKVFVNKPFSVYRLRFVDVRCMRSGNNVSSVVDVDIGAFPGCTHVLYHDTVNF